VAFSISGGDVLPDVNPHEMCLFPYQIPYTENDVSHGDVFSLFPAFHASDDF
jgi:hypothetical protein